MGPKSAVPRRIVLISLRKYNGLETSLSKDGPQTEVTRVFFFFFLLSFSTRKNKTLNTHKPSHPSMV